MTWGCEDCAGTLVTLSLLPEPVCEVLRSVSLDLVGPHGRNSCGKAFIIVHGLDLAVHPSHLRIVCPSNPRENWKGRLHRRQSSGLSRISVIFRLPFAFLCFASRPLAVGKYDKIAPQPPNFFAHLTCDTHAFVIGCLIDWGCEHA